ncbi:MAG: hypothetical protein ACK59A_11905 [Cyanobacteriota bacterium]|jgi:phage tail protein X
MIDANSRYAQAPQAEIIQADGSTVRYIVPPILPQPDHYQPARRVRTTDSDRSDILAAQAYGQPTAWWLLANANGVAHPDDLTTTPDSLLVIPLPDLKGVNAG